MASCPSLCFSVRRRMVDMISDHVLGCPLGIGNTTFRVLMHNWVGWIFLDSGMLCRCDHHPQRDVALTHNRSVVV